MLGAGRGNGLSPRFLSPPPSTLTKMIDPITWFSSQTLIRKMAELIYRTDPLPVGPKRNPREEMPLSLQQKYIANGEHVVISILDFNLHPERGQEFYKIKIEYPSGYVEEIPLSVFEDRYTDILKLQSYEFRKKVLSYLYSYKRIALFVNESDIRTISDINPNVISQPEFPIF